MTQTSRSISWSAGGEPEAAAGEPVERPPPAAMAEPPRIRNASLRVRPISRSLSMTRGRDDRWIVAVGVGPGRSFGETDHPVDRLDDGVPSPDYLARVQARELAAVLPAEHRPVGAAQGAVQRVQQRALLE